MQSQARTEIQPADSEAEASAHHDDALLWLSPSRARWAGPGRMPTLRQVELIEEYISSLPPLHWNRQTYSERPHESLQRDQTVELKPSKVISGLTAVYLKSTNMNKSEEAAAAAAGPMAASSSSSSDSNALLLDYPGWVMTAEEYENFGYAIHTAVSALDLEDPEEMHNYVILGNPSRVGAQVNCVYGTTLEPNVRLYVNSRMTHPGVTNQVETLNLSVSSHGIASDEAVASASADARMQLTAEEADLELPQNAGQPPRSLGQPRVDHAYVTVRPIDVLHEGDELWLNYGESYWTRMAEFCPKCLEYGGSAGNEMILCDHPGCKAGWHQQCLSPPALEADLAKEHFYCPDHAHLH